MPSVPQLADALTHVLTVVAEEAGRTVGFIRRQRVLDGATFVQGLVLGWLEQPQATLHHLTQALAVRGAVISPQGLAQRFGPEAAALLGVVLAAAVRATAMAAEPVVPVVPLWQRFGGGVWVVDCTTIRLPDALASVWPGCGGRTGSGTQAALKLQVRLDVARGGLEGPVVLAGRTQDKAGPLHTASLPPDALLLADLGFWSLERLGDLAQSGGWWVSRLKPQTHVLSLAGTRLDLPRWLADQGGPTVEAEVLLGATARLPVRVLAARVPPAVAATRRRTLRVEAQREGKTPPAATLALADWTVYVTNVPAARLSLEEVFVLGRTRWQIELLFKLWKQHGHLDTSRSAQPWRILCEIYAKLIALIIQHWLLLLGCWDRPDRSLVQAAQTIRTHAICLLRTIDRPARLRDEVGAIVTCLHHGCRVAKRRRRPSAYQLWLDPALAGLT